MNSIKKKGYQHYRCRLTQLLLWFFFLAVTTIGTSYGQERRYVTDAIADTDYVPEFSRLTTNHQSKILIDRYHNTIYALPEAEQGTKAMLDIMQADGFHIQYLDTYPAAKPLVGDILIIHGLPNTNIDINQAVHYGRSPLTHDVLDKIVSWVANGGGLFLTLSHHPGGSGAKPLLEAFDVKFRDGYLYSPTFPSFISNTDRCSHFFGMTAKQGLLNKQHGVFSMGAPVESVDFHCGAAVFRRPEDVIIQFPGDAGNYDQQDRLLERSHLYAGLIGFTFGQGKVVIATDQGMFRNFVFTFNTQEKVYVTITSPENDNAGLFVNLLRWLSSRTNKP